MSLRGCAGWVSMPAGPRWSVVRAVLGQPPEPPVLADVGKGYDPPRPCRPPLADTLFCPGGMSASESLKSIELEDRPLTSAARVVVFASPWARALGWEALESEAQGETCPWPTGACESFRRVPCGH